MALIAHYRLDGKTTNSVGDYSGVANGAIDWVDGKLGKCANFNNGYISNPAISDYLHGRPEASIAMWVKKDSINYGLLQLSGFADSNGNLYPYDTNFKVYLDVFRTNRLGPIIMPSSVLDWHHLIITQAPGVWKLYQNGQLVHQATADQFVSTNYLEFEIGRNSNSRYLDGQVSDVRVYDHALSEREIRDLSLGLYGHFPLVNDTLDVLSEKVIDVGTGTFIDSDRGSVMDISTGSASIALSEMPLRLNDETISFWMKSEWTLANSLAFNGSSFSEWIVHWGDYHTHNSGGIGLYRGKLTSYLRGPGATGWTNSFSFTAGDSIYNEGGWIHYSLRITAANVLSIHMNGKVVATQTLSKPFTGQSLGNLTFGRLLKSQISDVRIYSTALTDNQILELYQQKASIDSLGNIHTHRLLESGYRKPLMASYEVWADGQSGSVTGFNQNGSTNTRVKAIGPHGNEIVIWKGNSNGVSGPNAGWNSDYFPIDSSKLYRFSVWIRREVQGNGSAYLGCNAQGGHVLRVPGGTTSDSNPYFWVGTPGSEWELVVGHIFPHGYTGPMHPDSGRYTKAGRLGNTNGDFAWHASTVGARHRSYLYYASNADTEQHFAYPRVDLCDGTEPTIDELLSGHDLLWSQNGFPRELGISDKGLALGGISEVGPANGLIAWAPLDNSYLDLVTGKDVKGVHTEGFESDTGHVGATFTGITNNTVEIPVDDNIGTGWHMSAWVMLRRFDASTYPIILSSNLPYLATTNTGSSLRLSYSSGEQKNLTTSARLTANTWHHIGGQYDPDTNEVHVLLDGAKVGTAVNAGAVGDIGSILRVGAHTRTSYRIDGIVANVRVYNRALSSEEVATLHAITDPNSKQNMMVSATTTYAKRQFKEVIA